MCRDSFTLRNIMAAFFNQWTFIIFSLFQLMTASASIQKIFKKDKKGVHYWLAFYSSGLGCWSIHNWHIAIYDFIIIVPLLDLRDIISALHVHSEISCSFGCLKEPTCVGFKYKHGVNSPSVNCQLSNSTGKNNMADDDDQGWVYFVDIKSKLVRKCAWCLKITTHYTSCPTSERKKMQV